MVFKLIDPNTVLGEPIAPQTAFQMNYPFDVPAIRAEMERILSIPRCGNFVKQLLSLVETPTNKLIAGGDVLKVFDMIMAQDMALPKLVRTRDLENGADPSLNFNLAIGRLSTNNARIQIGGYRPPRPVTRAELKIGYVKSDAGMCLHETIHHCGERIYSDQVLAEAVSGMTGTSLPVPGPGMDIRPVYSDYWDDVLRETYE